MAESFGSMNLKFSLTESSTFTTSECLSPHIPINICWAQMQVMATFRSKNDRITTAEENAYQVILSQGLGSKAHYIGLGYEELPAIYSIGDTCDKEHIIYLIIYLRCLFEPWHATEHLVVKRLNAKLLTPSHERFCSCHVLVSRWALDCLKTNSIDK